MIKKEEMSILGVNKIVVINRRKRGRGVVMEPLIFPDKSGVYMSLTEEQKQIIDSTGNIKINAIAGSGKTTTVIAYAKARPRTARILYLAFNKSVKQEAKRKFQDLGLTNVRVETAHSLAYQNVIYGSGYRIKNGDYNTHEIVELLGLHGNGEKYMEYVVANHIKRFVTYFCNSDKKKVTELNYLDIVSDVKARSLVKSLYKYIERQTRILLAMMQKGKIEIIHDFYLKKYQLSNPHLPYDYILFDEGQDASPAMLDVFLRQKATKIIVGDTHQQIYGWRHAVNSLANTDFKTYHLSTSFRFGEDIARLSKEILLWKEHLGKRPQLKIQGRGTSEKVESRAVLARTNIGLLTKAIEYVSENKDIESLYFEGNINSYTYADEGASLYDVLNLYKDKRKGIKDDLIRQMNSFAELQDYVDKTGDVQLSMMIDIVKEYGSRIYDLIREIKEKHIPHDNKYEAEIIFSTVHRCKGMEYDSVYLVDDFITEKKLQSLKLNAEKAEEQAVLDKLNEEINLLYVAITRSKNHLFIPEELMPEGFPRTSTIHVIKDESKRDGDKNKAVKVRSNSIYSSGVPLNQRPSGNLEDRAYIVEEMRKKHHAAYRPWTGELDKELVELYCGGVNIRDLAKHFGRTKGAIKSRLKRLEF